MQVLFEHGEEHGVVTKGLGLLPGGVTRLAADRLPHMGWNTVRPPASSVLFDGLPEESRFYFVHSYGVGDPAALAASGAAVTTAHHGTDFVAAVERGALSAAQFHPEKSADTGAAAAQRRPRCDQRWPTAVARSRRPRARRHRAAAGRHRSRPGRERGAA
jgi:glutamine amidotransferase